MARPAGLLGKGLVGDALRYGTATALRTKAAGLLGARALGRGIAGTRAGQAGIRTAGKIAAHPKVAPLVQEATEHGLRGLTAPANLAGRVAGRAVGGARGAKLGGKIGFGLDYAPDLYTGYQVARGIAGAHDPAEQKVKRQLQAGTTVERGAGALLGKNAVSAILRTLEGRSTATKVGLGAAAGAGLYANRHELRDHPALRAGAGVALGGAAVGVITRGRALGVVRRSSRAIYQTGLKHALREHMRVLEGGTPGPAHVHQANMVRRAIKGAALRDAQAARVAGTKAIRLPRKGIAGAAAAGGALGLATPPRQEIQR